MHLNDIFLVVTMSISKNFYHGMYLSVKLLPYIKIYVDRYLPALLPINIMILNISDRMRIISRLNVYSLYKMIYFHRVFINCMTL